MEIIQNGVRWIEQLRKEVLKDDIISIANGVTYRLILSIFPLAIFLISIIAFLELDPTPLLSNVLSGFPETVANAVERSIKEITENKRPSLLSGGLIAAVWSSSSGFQSLIKGINKIYGQRETRSFIQVRTLSMLFVFAFTMTAIASLVMLMFGDYSLALLEQAFPFIRYLEEIYTRIGMLVTLCMIVFTVMWMNKAAIAKPVSLRSVLPGSMITVLVWIVASKLFNVYVDHFSNYANVYGGLVGIVLLMLWLNIICVVLLVGSEINALCAQKRF